MSVLYPLIQALVLFAVAPLLSGITRVARARLHNRRGPGVLQEYRDIFKLLGRQSVGPDASGSPFLCRQGHPPHDKGGVQRLLGQSLAGDNQPAL